MGMWLPILMICSSPYIESCMVITGKELVPTKEQCFAESVAKGKMAMQSPTTYRVKPMCQVIPNKILPENKKGVNL